MLLLTVREWFGPSRRAMETGEKRLIHDHLKGFATHLPLSEAIVRLHRYQRAYNEKFAATVAVNFNLVAVTPIEDLSADALESVGVELVERLEAVAPATSNSGSGGRLRIRRR